jgi:hypothetical protein
VPLVVAVAEVMNQNIQEPLVPQTAKVCGKFYPCHFSLICSPHQKRHSGRVQDRRVISEAEPQRLATMLDFQIRTGSVLGTLVFLKRTISFSSLEGKRKRENCTVMASWSCELISSIIDNVVPLISTNFFEFLSKFWHNNL